MPRSTSQRARSSPSHRVVEHRKDHEDTKDGEATPVQRESTAKYKPRSTRQSKPSRSRSPQRARSRRGRRSQEPVEVAPEQTISLRAEVAQKQRHNSKRASKGTSQLAESSPSHRVEEHRQDQHSKRASKSTDQRARSSPSHRVEGHRQDHEDAEVGEATSRKREGTRKHQPKSSR